MEEIPHHTGDVELLEPRARLFGVEVKLFQTFSARAIDSRWLKLSKMSGSMFLTCLRFVCPGRKKKFQIFLYHQNNQIQPDMMPKTKTLNLSSIKLENFLKFLQNPCRASRAELNLKQNWNRAQNRPKWPFSIHSPYFIVVCCVVVQPYFDQPS